MHSRRKQREEVHLEPLIGWKIGRWAGVGDGRLGLRLVHGQGQGQGPGVVQSRLSDAFRGLSRLHVRPMTWRRFQSMACPACCVHTSVRRDKKKVRGPLGPPSVDPLAPHRWTPWPPLCGPLGPPSVDPWDGGGGHGTNVEKRLAETKAFDWSTALANHESRCVSVHDTARYFFFAVGATGTN